MTDLTTTNVFIDWMTAVGLVAPLNSYIRRFLGQDETKPIHPAYHRHIGRQYYPSMVKLFSSPEDMEKANVIVFDGEACNNLRVEWGEVDAIRIARILARSTDHFTRVDLAMDIMDGGQFARKFADDTMQDRVDFGRRSAKVIMGMGREGGTTTYVGARTSPKMMRVYDKAAESKGKLLSSRIEFELKAEAAEYISLKLNTFAAEALPSQLFLGLLNEFVLSEHFPEVERIRYGEMTTIDALKRERFMTKKQWLLKQVMPTFTRDASGAGKELWQWFKEEVASAL
jgi:hypothetical protein